MKTVDLTQIINEDMPVYPGTEKPILKNATSIEKDGFAEKLLTMYSHTGTHMDAPAHMVYGADTLDNFDISSFVGQGTVIRIESGTETISRAHIEKEMGNKKEIDFLLINTGWSSKWERESYFDGFPVLEEEAARYISNLDIKGIGFDCISADAVNSGEMTNHLLLLKAGKVIIENLCNLEKLAGKRFTFCCFPLKIEGADGSPIRAAGIEP